MTVFHSVRLPRGSTCDARVSRPRQAIIALTALGWVSGAVGETPDWGESLYCRFESRPAVLLVDVPRADGLRPYTLDDQHPTVRLRLSERGAWKCRLDAETLRCGRGAARLELTSSDAQSMPGDERYHRVTGRVVLPLSPNGESVLCYLKARARE